MTIPLLLSPTQLHIDNLKWQYIYLQLKQSIPHYFTWNGNIFKILKSSVLFCVSWVKIPNYSIGTQELGLILQSSLMQTSRWHQCLTQLGCHYSVEEAFLGENTNIYICNSPYINRQKNPKTLISKNLINVSNFSSRE